MQWPTLIVDNFFTDPHAVVKLSKTFKYRHDGNHAWPGTRSEPMHKEDNKFFLWSTRKIMALFYPAQIIEADGVKWNAIQCFHRVPYGTYGKEGWVHSDAANTEFTSIIYLSDHPQSGTCLYEGKHFNTHAKYLKEKEKFYKDLKAKVKKKQKQIRLNVGSTSQDKGRQSKPLPSLRKTNDPDSTS